MIVIFSKRLFNIIKELTDVTKNLQRVYIGNGISGMISITGHIHKYHRIILDTKYAGN